MPWLRGQRELARSARSIDFRKRSEVPIESVPRSHIPMAFTQLNHLRGSRQLHPVDHVGSLLLAHAAMVLGHSVDLRRRDVKLAIRPPRHGVRPLQALVLNDNHVFRECGSNRAMALSSMAVS
jgi:hypothetical protein